MIHHRKITAFSLISIILLKTRNKAIKKIIFPNFSGLQKSWKNDFTRMDYYLY